MTKQSRDQKQDEISLRELIVSIKGWIVYLKTKLLIIVLSGIIGGLCGFYYAYVQKAMYTASLNFALEDEKGGGMSGALGLASQFGFDLGSSAGGAFSGGNLIELIQSRTLVEKTLLDSVLIKGKPTSLAEYYLEFNGIRNGWEKHPEMAKVIFFPAIDRSKFSLQQDSILGKIYEALIDKNLSVTQKDKKIGIIYIDVKTENELFSKLFTENLAKEVSDYYIETKSKKSKFNVAILERQSDSIRNELNGAISNVASANDNTYNLNPALNVKKVPSLRRQVDVQANTVILTELVKNLELAKVSLRKETPLIQIIDKPILPLPKQKIGKMKTMVIGGFFLELITIVCLLIIRWWKKEELKF